MFHKSATMASLSLNALGQTIEARCKTLINNDLKKICKEEGQTQSGNKAQLQQRIFDCTYPSTLTFTLLIGVLSLTLFLITVIHDAVSRGDSELLTRLQYRVQHHGDYPRTGLPSQQMSATSMHSTSSPNQPHRYPNMNGYSQHPTNGYGQSHQSTSGMILSSANVDNGL